MTTSTPIRFFFKHAGYSYDPKTETPQRGRWRRAERIYQSVAEQSKQLRHFLGAKYDEYMNADNDY